MTSREAFEEWAHSNGYTTNAIDSADDWEVWQAATAAAEGKHKRLEVLNEQLRHDCIALRTILFDPRKVRELPKDIRDIIMEQAAKSVQDDYERRALAGEGGE